MEIKLVPYDQIPRELFLDMMHEIGNYSVALARITGDDATSLQILGSGTCVKRGTLHGILTAHHVLHAHKPPVRLGVEGPERIIFFAKNGRTPGANQATLIERPMGVPNGDGDYGPDLTFIPLPPDSSLRGTCSFWNLDQNPEEVIRTFAIDRACIVNAGYPALKYETRVREKTVHANVTLQGGAGALVQEDIVRRGEWDFINSECDYNAFPGLLTTFQGISGGGIWSALLGTRKGSTKLEVMRLGLVGVNFWQTGIAGGKRLIRGHFVRSIYDRAWAR